MLTLEQGLYLCILELENGPKPFPLQSGFNNDTAYRALGLFNPSETSDAYFILSNDRDEIWFICNRHLRTVCVSPQPLDFRRPLTSFSHPQNTNITPSLEDTVAGCQWVADWQQCACEDNLLNTADALQKICLAAVEKSGLTAVSHTFHQFEPVGATGVVLLAESHLAIHTWPEKNFVTMDLYVCNYKEDNRHKAQYLFELLAAQFKPHSKTHKMIERGNAHVA